MRFRSRYSSRAGGIYSTSLATVQYKQAYIYKAKLVSFLSESCVQQYFRHSLCPPDRPIKCATYHVPRISYLMPRALHLVLRTTYHAPRTSYIPHHIPFIVKLTSPSFKPPLPQSYLGSRVGRAISNNILVLSVCIIWKSLFLAIGCSLLGFCWAERIVRRLCQQEVSFFNNGHNLRLEKMLESLSVGIHYVVSLQELNWVQITWKTLIEKGEHCQQLQ